MREQMDLMRELRNAPMPGYGFGPTMATPTENIRMRDALLRDALAREDGTDAQQPARQAPRFELARRLVRIAFA